MGPRLCRQDQGCAGAVLAGPGPPRGCARAVLAGPGLCRGCAGVVLAWPGLCRGRAGGAGAFAAGRPHAGSRSRCHGYAAGARLGERPYRLNETYRYRYRYIQTHIHTFAHEESGTEGSGAEGVRQIPPRSRQWVSTRRVRCLPRAASLPPQHTPSIKRILRVPSARSPLSRREGRLRGALGAKLIWFGDV